MSELLAPMPACPNCGHQLLTESQARIKSARAAITLSVSHWGNGLLSDQELLDILGAQNAGVRLAVEERTKELAREWLSELEQ